MARAAVAALGAFPCSAARAAVAALGGFLCSAAVAVLVGRFIATIRRGDVLWYVAGGAFKLVGEVVLADGELELGAVGVTAHVVTHGETDSGDFSLGRKGKDIGCVNEKVLAEVSCCAGFLAEVIVADEEECGLGVVGDIANDVAELRSDLHTTEGHEMVDVIDNDKFRFVLLDKCFDLAVDEVKILPLVAENV